MPRFRTIGQAQVDPAEGWKFEPARAEPPQVGWQQPFLYSSRREVLEWKLASKVENDLRPELAGLHAVTRDWAPPSGTDPHGVAPGRINTHVPLRRAAQGLHTLVMVELHRGETAQAYTNLVTLVRFCRYHQDTWSLPAQMMRVGITALTLDALWQALQAPGWTEHQLKTLQQELARVDFIGPLAGTCEVARIGYLQDLATYRERGIEHLRTIYQGFGYATAKSTLWKQRLHFAHWRLSRDRDVEVEVIQEMQRLIEGSRLLAQGRPMNTLPAKPVPRPQSRFLRWFDDWANPIPGFSIIASYTGAPNLDRAFTLVVCRQAQLQLALVALALEQSHLATGKLPKTLEELAPEYLDAIPVNPFDGEPLRYEPGPEETFTLYFRDGDGSVRRLTEERLDWPVAELPLPLPEPTRMEPVALSDEVLPLVAFDQAPLLDVIKLLARQAKMNMVFDHRVMKQEYPPINLHLENVTAFEALKHLLRENRLRLERDPKSSIHIITL